FKLPVSMIPKAKIIGNQTGLYKAIVDRKTNKILGATIFAEESHEVINIIATAMKLNADYTVLKEQIFTHPTMAEALNDLFQ
ncbi:MAG: pyridine nucleotide-disulfide oxidoreductase, partial [Erysipelotrichaceae bacterium]|nr:pyridine nucleotide-disulfide oxidoreductase [Erysipelotrichaceae bacterium]